ncbi:MULTISPECIES: ABC transporter ATP-binding protein [Bacillus subtilis group]|uniref:ABC transporter ATP-binding protein n=1 Tax=Bacillus subtilis group TaxID=653685 RepID=UPI00227EFC8F|nr:MULTISPECIES: ABC transporter ATP-binding protein [Bacillus subtilis group]MCY7908311.1 ABC transporter ATP-binding protein/permease [Bacillus inaquosorum]MED1124357.1 ABC transporter ATP-binding protein [Bacillus atrophaeus]
MLNNVLFRSFKYVWLTAKWWLVYNLLYSLLSGLIPLITLWITKELINETSHYLAGEENLYNVTKLIGLQFLVLLSNSLLELFKKIIDEKANIILEHKLKAQILKKVSSVSMDLFDNPRFFNTLVRIENSSGSRFLSPINELFSFVKNITSSITVCLYLLSFHWILLVVGLIPVFPYFLVQLKYGSQKFNLIYNYTPLLRDADVTSKLITDRSSAKEVKIYGLSNHLFNRWSEKYLKNGYKHLLLNKKQQFSLFGIEGTVLIVHMIVIFILLKVVNNNGILGIGEFVSIIQAVENTQSKIQQSADNAANIFEERLYLKDFFDFIDRVEPTSFNKHTKCSFPVPLKSSIEIKDITFRYLNGSKKVLNKVSFSITPGEKIFIVGENGSGKSTLIKILLGLYPIQQGDILFDGISIKDLNSQELHRNLTALFQDYVKYPYTIYENIGFGDIEKFEHKDLIEAISKETGLDEIVSKYNDGYQTYLTKTLYDGEDLSGGQWQKVSLTRALFRNSQLIVLDEPTAALDPKKEKEVFQQFNDIATGKTAIYISHRMSAAKLADRIIVLKEGKIIEDGTFNELMQQNGEFKEMYEIQSSQFSEEKTYTLSQ